MGGAGSQQRGQHGDGTEEGGIRARFLLALAHCSNESRAVQRAAALANQLLLDFRSVRRIDLGAALPLRLLRRPSAVSENLTLEPAPTQEDAMAEIMKIHVPARA
jgi:hypothetical protein